MTYFDLNEIIMKSSSRDWVNSESGRRIYSEDIDVTIAIHTTDEIR